MEKKNNFISLLLYSIKEKRNWALLSTVIIFLSTLIIPYILRADEDSFIVLGIVELFILVLINCLVDNSFLHNESKLTYYRSKPVTLNKQILINIITNAVFTIYLIALIFIASALQGANFEIIRSFKMLIPWLSAMILLASLSSILSGNTLMAGAMTIFNFCLPLIILLVTMFIFTILENIVIGFSADILNDYFINNIYKLEYVYFTKYITDRPIDLTYLLLLPAILAIIYLLLNKFTKVRKNENTGFIVFNGYKYFVSVLASLIVPALFSISLSRYTSITNRLIISVLLAVLTYYIIIAFMEKSFRISKSSIKIFVAGMALFTAVTGGTVLVANHYKSYVPNPQDVEMAYVGSQRWSISQLDRFLKGQYPNENMSLEEFKRQNNIIMYEDTDNIINITKLHKEVINDQTFNQNKYYGWDNFVVAYWMKDGSVIRRDYLLKPEEEVKNEHEIKNQLSNNIINSQEYKKQKYYYLYDSQYYSGRNLYAKLRIVDEYSASYSETYYDFINLNDLRELLISDIDSISFENDMAFSRLFMNYYYPYYDKEIGLNEKGYFLEIYEEVSDARESYLDEIYLRGNFVNTLNYFK